MGCITGPELVPLKKLPAIPGGTRRQVQCVTGTDSKMVRGRSADGCEICATPYQSVVVEHLRLCKGEFKLVNLVHLLKQFEMAVKEPLSDVMLQHLCERIYFAARE